MRVTHGVHAPASFLGLLEVFLLEEGGKGGRETGGRVSVEESWALTSKRQG